MSYELPDWFSSDDPSIEADVFVEDAVERFLLNCSPEMFLNQSRLVLNFETLSNASPSYLFVLYELTKHKMPQLNPISDQEAQ